MKISIVCSIVGLVCFSSVDALCQTEPPNFCRVTLNRADALDFPSKHAWNLFQTLVHPSKDLSFGRGIPDCTKRIGAPGTTSVWEMWRLARTEVFLADGAMPPDWNDTTLPHAYLGAVPDPDSPHDPARIQEASARLDPAPDQGVFKDHGGIGETHMNRATYEFIKANCLHSFDGLSRYSKAVLEGKKPPLSFPSDSIEVKAVWLEFSPDDLKANKQLRYYVGRDPTTGKQYGLMALHILTKDLPNWFWATFHHVDEPKNEFEGVDTYGRPKELDGTIWANYVLGGTQIDFIKPTGDQTILSDYYVEFQFQKSSCMTCHANAHGHPDPERTPNGKLARDARGRIVAAGEGPLQTIDLGIPAPDAFKRDAKPFFVQTDFLWSIPFRAREEQTAPPDYCLR
ncbi:hypothetical protein [Bradyrhizobium elkanii]|uniref:hypothetical protein n=1 Tax=Bradyrhizobium elkanii TaxID=29448 RepID=UPI001BA48241|nr:hypothetical protein [Bradyrhizobium elkanii]MBR1164604.1 hypothetical protein [Bradyrhizobium elkanii]